MKNLKLAAVIVVLAMNIVSVIISFDYYKSLFEALTSSVRYTTPIQIVQTFLYILVELFELALCFIFLFASASVRDKAYKLLRFYFVIYFIFQLTILFLVNYGGNAATWQLVYIVAMRLVALFCAVVFLIAKPERRVERIDISDYELVAYTSAGHRFVHYLLDLLFFLPLWLPWLDILSYGRWDMGPTFLSRIVLLICYFLYYFTAEAIFRQTFGKICTDSCVVSNGLNLTTGRVFLRTLSRYIPFDGLSFLWKGNWHDSVSSTAVVYVNTWEKVFDEVAPTDDPVQNPA